MAFSWSTLRRARWWWTLTLSLPCWRDAELLKPELHRLKFKGHLWILCARPEWGKEQWFFVITGMLVISFLCARKFRKALIEATDSWAMDIDRGLVNAVVVLDLKKAFHTVDHFIQKIMGRGGGLAISHTREARDKRPHLALLVWFPKFPGVNLFLVYPRLVLNMIFYGIMLYVPGLAGNMYQNIFLMFVIDLPHTPMAWIVFK